MSSTDPMKVDSWTLFGIKPKNFASTVSLSAADAKHKVIIIDEADNTTHDVQLLLRANIEAFYNNCRFIFTCNYKNKIIEPLHADAPVLIFPSLENKNLQSLPSSSVASKKSWVQKVLNLITRSW